MSKLFGRRLLYVKRMTCKNLLTASSFTHSLLYHAVPYHVAVKGFTLCTRLYTKKLFKSTSHEECFVSSRADRQMQGCTHEPFQTCQIWFNISELHSTLMIMIEDCNWSCAEMNMPQMSVTGPIFIKSSSWPTSNKFINKKHKFNHVVCSNKCTLASWHIV
jgi:hypothetical protein